MYPNVGTPSVYNLKHLPLVGFSLYMHAIFMFFSYVRYVHCMSFISYYNDSKVHTQTAASMSNFESL